MPDQIVYALSATALPLARSLGAALGAPIHAPARIAEPGMHGFDSLADLVAGTFAGYDGHVFVAAAGIVVRTIAPHLTSKERDPAVVCLDPQGAFAISLLSGHLGGGNALARRCAEISGGKAVITTATDCAGLPSLDLLARERNMAIGNLGRVKTVNAALLEGRRVQLYDPGDYLRASDSEYFQPVVTEDRWVSGEPGVWVSWRRNCPDEGALRLYPRVLMLGVGCRRGTGGEEISTHIRAVFRAADLSFLSIGGLGSIEAKADEEGLLDAAQELGVVPEFFPAGRLDAVDAPNPSGTVMRRMGVGSVSEASALLLARGGELLVEKTKTRTVTLAVARSKTC
jgi:cobalt-precorrin 5A hydrolase